MKFLIVHPEGNISVNPNLYAMVESLNENGYKVDILSLKRSGFNQKVSSLSGKLYLLKTYTFLFKINKYRGIWGKLLQLLISLTCRQYGLILGVDRDGIIAAEIISRLSGIPYALISYEIFFMDEVRQDFKEEEINACKNISFAICQDQVRSKKLSEENKIPEHKIINIPVAGRYIHNFMFRNFIFFA